MNNEQIYGKAKARCKWLDSNGVKIEEVLKFTSEETKDRYKKATTELQKLKDQRGHFRKELQILKGKQKHLCEDTNYVKQQEINDQIAEINDQITILRKTRHDLIEGPFELFEKAFECKKRMIRLEEEKEALKIFNSKNVRIVEPLKPLISESG